jgi:cytochrome c oxidase cbb3-type subunit 3
VLRLSDADTLEILEKGVPAGMPSFRSLGKAKLKAVLNYLRTLQGRGNTATLPGDPQRGQVLFFGKPRCSECHMIHGKGGFLGDDLSKYGLTVPPAEIRSAIAAPGEDSDPRQRTASVTTRNGQKYTGIVRNEDNFSLQLQSSDGAFHLLLKSDLEHLEFLPTPVMPPDYGSTLSAAELDDLVAYLVNVARTGRSANPAGSKPHEEDDD